MSTRLLLALLLLVAWTNSAKAEETLQRLFTTAEERAELDRRRAHGVPQAVETVEQAQKVELNGYIIRRDGKNVVWVNGQSSINKDKSQDDIQVDTKGIAQQRVPVYLPEGKVSLKPGQVYARGVGTVTESYLVKDATPKAAEDTREQTTSDETAEDESR